MKACVDCGFYLAPQIEGVRCIECENEMFISELTDVLIEDERLSYMESCETQYEKEIPPHQDIDEDRHINP